jgi:hypothetical protein
MTTCATAVDMTPVAKHMPMTSLLNFIRWLLDGFDKGNGDKTLVSIIMKLIQSFAIRVFEELFYLLLLGSTGFKVGQ